MNFKKEYTCIKVKDLKPDSIYGKINRYAGISKPVLVYLSKIFKGEDYEEVTRDLNYHGLTCQMGVNFALYTQLNKQDFMEWTVGYAYDSRNGVGFIEVSRELVPEMEKFMKHVDMLAIVCLQMQGIMDKGFSTVLDALVRVTGQKDLKKKIEKEPQLVKLFERIDDSLS